MKNICRIICIVKKKKNMFTYIGKHNPFIESKNSSSSNSNKKTSRNRTQSESVSSSSAQNSKSNKKQRSNSESHENPSMSLNRKRRNTERMSESERKYFATSLDGTVKAEKAMPTKTTCQK